MKYRRDLYRKSFLPLFLLILGSMLFGCEKSQDMLKRMPVSPQPVTVVLGATCTCLENLYVCEDFGNQAEAQACFDLCQSLGVGDIHELDSDHNLVACEEHGNNGSI